MPSGAGEYVRLCALATGGMAEVDVVVRREGRFTRLYAQKRLLSHLCADLQLRAMFLDEARYAGLLRHANVVSVIDIGEDHRGPYLVMEFVDGVSLSELTVAQLGADTPLPMGLALRIGAQIAEGLHAAHELRDPDGSPLGLVHRDVSPQNVLVGFDGVVRVADFGIAKALGQSTKTSTGVLKGKLGYMSPEQLRFEQPDRRSDLFALGVVLYELLAGRRLYSSDGEFEGPKRILTEPPPDVTDDRPDTPASVVELLFELLAKDAANRPDTARDVSRRLQVALAELASDEPSVDLPEYLEAMFGAKRRARNALLSQRIAELDQQRTPTASGALVTERPAPPRGRKVLPTAVALLALLGAVLLVAAWPRADFPTDAQLPAAAQPAPASVTLTIESSPAGAALTLDGVDRGVTPATVTLPRSSDPIALTLYDGARVAVEERVVPDVDQRLQFVLSAAPAGSASAAVASAPPAPPPRRAPTGPRPSHARASASAAPAASQRDFRKFE